MIKKSTKVREILQFVGTEIGRNTFGNNIWINALFADYIGHCNSQFCLSTKQCPDEHITKDCNAIYPNWIITDTRFPNELQAIKERNGIVIRINRNRYPTERDDIKLTQRAETFLSGNIPEHESETALDNAEFDYVIDNNSDIPQLIEEVRKMLVHFKILWKEY